MQTGIMVQSSHKNNSSNTKIVSSVGVAAIGIAMFAVAPWTILVMIGAIGSTMLSKVVGPSGKTPSLSQHPYTEPSKEVPQKPVTVSKEESKDSSTSVSNSEAKPSTSKTVENTQSSQPPKKAVNDALKNRTLHKGDRSLYHSNILKSSLAGICLAEVKLANVGESINRFKENDDMTEEVREKIKNYEIMEKQLRLILRKKYRTRENSLDWFDDKDLPPPSLTLEEINEKIEEYGKKPSAVESFGEEIIDSAKDYLKDNKHSLVLGKEGKALADTKSASATVIEALSPDAKKEIEQSAASLVRSGVKTEVTGSSPLPCNVPGKTAGDDLGR